MVATENPTTGIITGPPFTTRSKNAAINLWGRRNVRAIRTVALVYT
jgi:hypothetical protein